MSIETVVLIFIILFVIGVFPSWQYSKSWGYAPTGILTLCLVIFLVWAIAGGRPLFRNSVGDDIRSAGQDVADSVKRVVQ
jgi:hypothetical protein